MKLLMMLFSILMIAAGIVSTITIIGAFVGVPLILVGLLFFLLSFILPIRL